MTDNRPGLSPSQVKVYAAINILLAQRPYPPTIRELCLATGLRSSSTIHAHLVWLRDNGYIDFENGSPRTISLGEPNAAKAL